MFISFLLLLFTNVSTFPGSYPATQEVQHFPPSHNKHLRHHGHHWHQHWRNHSPHTTIISILIIILTTRPKLAYGRQGLGWDCGAGMQFRWVHRAPIDPIEKVLFCRGPHSNKVISCKVIYLRYILTDTVCIVIIYRSSSSLSLTPSPSPPSPSSSYRQHHHPWKRHCHQSHHHHFY